MNSFDDQRNIVSGIIMDITAALSRLDPALHKSINVNPVMEEITKLEKKLVKAVTHLLNNELLHPRYEARVVLYPRK